MRWSRRLLNQRALTASPYLGDNLIDSHELSAIAFGALGWILLACLCFGLVMLCYIGFPFLLKASVLGSEVVAEDIGILYHASGRFIQPKKQITNTNIKWTWSFFEPVLVGEPHIDGNGQLSINNSGALQRRQREGIHPEFLIAVFWSRSGLYVGWRNSELMRRVFNNPLSTRKDDLVPLNYPMKVSGRNAPVVLNAHRDISPSVWATLIKMHTRFPSNYSTHRSNKLLSHQGNLRLRGSCCALSRSGLFNNLFHSAAREVDGQAHSDQGEDGDSDDYPIGPYINVKWRFWVSSWTFLCVLILAGCGFSKIQSSGLVEDEAKARVQLTIGIAMVVAAWLFLHAGLDITTFGIVYRDHLIFYASVAP
jgi:hypothetical protein